MRTTTAFFTAAILPVFLFAGQLAAQQPQALTLEDVLRIAEDKSDEVAAARARRERAQAQEARARSQMLPQLTGSASYNRTLATQFDDLIGADLQPCPPLEVMPGAPLADRVTELERFVTCPGALLGIGDPDGLFGLPFGRTNIWHFGLAFSQTVLDGGRIRAERNLARAGRRGAEIEMESADAQFLLDVSQAYYDAALADSMLQVAELTLEQADETLRFVQLGYDEGQQSEFDLLRARVSRDNQLPAVVRRRAQRNQAYMRLQQLLKLAPDEPLLLDAGLDDASLPVPFHFARRLEEAEKLSVQERVPVRQAQTQVEAREQGMRAARAQRWPTFSLTSQYGLFAYPTTFFPTTTEAFRNDWTVGAALQVPIFAGGRIAADERSARAELEEAQARLRQSRELAWLDTAVTRDDLQASLESWRAAAGTVQHAARVYEIAELRFREGASTQLELTDARVQFEQARANRAQAARDLQVSRVRTALLPYLPLAVTDRLPEALRVQPLPTTPATAQPPPARPFPTLIPSTSGALTP